MATAKTTQVHKMIVEEGVELCLTRGEAHALALVLAKVAGRPEGTRGLVTNIYEALEGLGFQYEEHPAYGSFEGYFRFHD